MTAPPLTAAARAALVTLEAAPARVNGNVRNNLVRKGLATFTNPDEPWRNGYALAITEAGRQVLAEAAPVA